MLANKWYVLTGGPSSGKTSLIEELQRRGKKVVPEMARNVIDKNRDVGQSVAETRKDEKKFQEEVFVQKVLVHNALEPELATFFDRGYHDTIAYLEYYGHEVLAEIKAICNGFQYDKVFLLEMLDYVKDEARIETFEVAKDLHTALKKAYIQSGHTVIDVPVMTVSKRADFILSQL